MNGSIFMPLPILLPIICGGFVYRVRMRKRRTREIFVLASVLATSLLMGALIVMKPAEPLILASLPRGMLLALKLDGLGMTFAAIASLLWPIATVYAFEYMKHEGREVRFFCFYTISFGVTLGIALAGNLLTMYLFYELLTLSTLPLVMHKRNEKAIAAGKKYVIYSIGGASICFISMVFIYHFAGEASFVMGGILSGSYMDATVKNAFLLVFLTSFIGFGVKAAVFPFHGWLPTASVAPTTVTALLHAVAVVKAGAFAAMRSTYYIFGADFVRGTWAQEAALSLACFTILFGSVKALREQHFKRRLAYSTISNLSYIMFGVALATPLGLRAALVQMTAHALIKITLFYCAGAVIYKTHYEYVSQLVGLGKRMPIVMGCFAFASLGLMGVPLLPGFHSKISLLAAAADEGGRMAFAGLGALLVSSLLTALYLMSIVVPAYFPRREFRMESVADTGDPNYLMTGPLLLLCAMCLLTGIFPSRIMSFFSDVAAGLL